MKKLYTATLIKAKAVIPAKAGIQTPSLRRQGTIILETGFPRIKYPVSSTGQAKAGSVKPGMTNCIRVMPSYINVCCALILLLLVGSGCAGIKTYPARPNEPHGIRVYPQKIYLLVDKEKNVSQLVSLPDIKNAYDIKPWSILSKHDFTIKIEEAQVKELESNQDSSAALSFLQKIVELAAKTAEKAMEEGAGRAVADVKFGSSLGFDTGIYELSETGTFKKVGP